MKHGVFLEQLENDEIKIERRIFAHQYFNRLLVTQLVVERKRNETKNEIQIQFENIQKIRNETRDLIYTVPEKVNDSDYVIM